MRSAYGGKSSRRPRHRPVPQTPTPRPEDRLSMGFFKRLMTPKDEEHFVDGMRQFVLTHETAALRHFSQAEQLADAAFMAGILSLQREALPEAERFFKAAKSRHATLGRYFHKYGVQASVALAITDEVAA